MFVFTIYFCFACCLISSPKQPKQDIKLEFSYQMNSDLYEEARRLLSPFAEDYVKTIQQLKDETMKLKQLELNLEIPFKTPKVIKWDSPTLIKLDAEEEKEKQPPCIKHLEPENWNKAISFDAKYEEKEKQPEYDEWHHDLVVEQLEEKSSHELRKICSQKHIKWRDARGKNKHLTKPSMIAAIAKRVSL